MSADRRARKAAPRLEPLEGRIAPGFILTNVAPTRPAERAGRARIGLGYPISGGGEGYLIRVASEVGRTEGAQVRTVSQNGTRN